MISTPPGFSATITGISYALNLALKKADPTPEAHPHDSTAIAQALWFRFIIAILNGAIILGLGDWSPLILFILISAIDTLSYPVVSHAVLNRAGLGSLYPCFITAYTWVGNLRILMLMTIGLLAANFEFQEPYMIMFPFALWMLWAAWSVATRALGRGGWVGAGMVLLAVILEMILGLLIIMFINPAVPLESI